MGTISVNEMKTLLHVYFIMGSNNCYNDPKEVLTKAIEGGATLFQFREKGTNALVGKEKVLFAKELQHICKQYGVPFIVNDDVDLAIELNADGVHIGQDDESAGIVRRRIGEGKILGVSTHHLDEVKRAIEQGADYVGIGPVFATVTKEDAKAVRGTVLIREVREKGLSIPIVGIGGITEQNAKVVMEAGGDGVSVITAISQAENPLETTKRLAEVVFLNSKQ
ncbi:thiamine phosphate synthase [Metabacillus iocasae]|uniref:Thiamine-phosphate synthase n=1 Tax=Priestia iocasae TaxID=2291674 RepID=A0ABS2QT63_9BACI|nr:thiamine phosphate synthase [Metabacillus iocasae]MBM7702217.1 thiamine-phosphate pyrophosphorylase [Metabacillus iocasae]